MRTVAVARVATMTVLAALVLSGCQVAVSGSAGLSPADQQRADRRAEQRAAVDAALKAFAAQPVAVYHGSAPDSGGKPVDLTLRVTKNGTALGSLLLDGQQAQLVVAGGKLFLSASAGYWKSRSSTPELGDLYAKGWALAEASELPVNPGAVLLPAKASDKIRGSLSKVDQLADPVRAKLSNGVEVFEIKSSLGKLQVTTAQPNRLVSVPSAAIDPAAAGVLGAQLTLDAAPADVVAKFHADLDSTLGGLGQPYDSVAQASARISDNKFQCDNGNASCTSTVKIDNSLVGGDSSGSTVHVVLNVTVTADNLGAQTCGAETNAAPNTTSTLACTVKFTLPNRTAEYKVVSQPTATADVRAAFDPNAIKQKVQVEFAGLGG